jgi:hypothetical protein
MHGTFYINKQLCFICVVDAIDIQRIDNSFGGAGVSLERKYVLYCHLALLKRFVHSFHQISMLGSSCPDCDQFCMNSYRESKL